MQLLLFRGRRVFRMQLVAIDGLPEHFADLFAFWFSRRFRATRPNSAPAIASMSAICR